jgi:hypothetical protein
MVCVISDVWSPDDIERRCKLRKAGISNGAAAGGCGVEQLE